MTFAGHPALLQTPLHSSALEHRDPGCVVSGGSDAGARSSPGCRGHRVRGARCEVRGRRRRCGCAFQKNRGSLGSLLRLAHPPGLAPGTPCLEGRCSIQLSYGHKPSTSRIDLEHRPRGCAEKSGRGDTIRTCDFQFPKLALYQAELRPGTKTYHSRGASSPRKTCFASTTLDTPA